MANKKPGNEHISTQRRTKHRPKKRRDTKKLPPKPREVEPLTMPPDNSRRGQVAARAAVAAYHVGLDRRKQRRQQNIHNLFTRHQRITAARVQRVLGKPK